MSNIMTDADSMRDASGYKMHIVRDDGECRHICFGNDKFARSKNFKILTWPGHLCLTGGKGSYVFHTPAYSDLFEAFREYRSEKLASNGSLMVDIDRLAEWVIAADISVTHTPNSPFFSQACRHIAWAVARYDYGKKLIPLNKAIAEAEKRVSNQPDDQENKQLVGWLKDYRDILEKQWV